MIGIEDERVNTHNSYQLEDKLPDNITNIMNCKTIKAKWTLDAICKRSIER